MKKIHIKRKRLRISSIAVISLLLLFSSGPLAHADLPDPDYYIGYIDIQTRTNAGSAPQTVFWFTIRDANYYHAPTLESVVDSVTITFPDGEEHTFFAPDLIASCKTVRESRDDNPQDGIIDPFAGEYETRAACYAEYEVISPISPHAAGTYEMQVTCNNGQILSSLPLYVEAGMTAAELPPVTNITASFNPDGLFQVSWDLPEGGYPSGARIQVRVERYENRIFSRYDRFDVRNLPINQTSHTFFKWESDILRLYTGYIEVKVRTWMRWDSVANSEVKGYRIKRLLKKFK